MSDKKSDGRDVFDTALDYAVPVGAAALGAVAGSKGLRFLRRQVHRQVLTKAERAALRGEARKSTGETMFREEGKLKDAAYGRNRAAWKRLDADEADRFKQAVTGLGGGAVGGGAGFVYGSANRRKK